MKKKPQPRRKEKAPQPMPDTAYGPSPQREDYEAQDGLRTLTRAHKLMSDKGLMKRIKAHAQKEKDAHERVLRLEGKEL